MKHGRGGVAGARARRAWRAWAGAAIALALRDAALAVTASAAGAAHPVAGAAASAAAGASAVPPPVSLVAALDRRAAHGGIDAVNAHLLSRTGAAERMRLGRQAEACEPDALRLSVQLGRGRDAKAAWLHHEALRAAAGRCVGTVLSLLAPHEVPKVCASQSSWSVVQTARELRRRIALLDADELLRDTANGRACRAAYWHELTTTRVVVRRVAPAASRP